MWTFLMNFFDPYLMITFDHQNNYLLKFVKLSIKSSLSHSTRGFLFWWSSKLPICYSFSTDFDKNCFCLCGYFFRLQWEFIYFFGNQIWIEMCYNHLVIFIVFFRDTPLLMAIGPNGTNHDKFCNQWTNCSKILISKTFLNKNPPCWHSALPQAHHHPWKEGHPWWES